VTKPEAIRDSRHSASGVPRGTAHPNRAAFWLGIAGAVAALGALIWTYWATLVVLVEDWRGDDDYSVGQLVPLVALWLLWRRRAAIRKCSLAPCWWGIGLILLAQAARAFGLLFLYESAERYSIVLTLAGVALLVAGRQVFRQVFWIWLFLFLMIPFPGRIHNMISGPLQTLATVGAVFLLEVFGVTVAREGNVILLNDGMPLAVAEACSGLRMLTAFIVVAATLAFLIRRPRWQKLALLVSSVPIAIFCNLVRLVVTAILYLTAGSETAERFFHDFAGLAMMPLAVLILAGELWLMKKLVVVEEPAPARAGARARAHGKHKANAHHK
jgi:exosortase